MIISLFINSISPMGKAAKVGLNHLEFQTAKKKQSKPTKQKRANKIPKKK